MRDRVSKTAGLLELDGKGDISRQKTYGGAGSDYAVYIQQVIDDGYIIAGNTSSSSAGKSDLWILKVDSKGQIPNFDKTRTCEASISDTCVVAQKSDCQVESISVRVMDTTVAPQSSSAKTSD